jgi:hypothetical protein
MSRTRVGLSRRIVVLLALVLAGLIATTSSAWASPPSAAHGHDVSHPECGQDLPTGGAFGIVGINGGKPFSANPCLAAQYRWALTRPSGAAVYVNAGNPAPTSAHYWARSGSSDPALCVDAGSTTDVGCAYDYGWHAAAYALTTARRLGTAVLDRPWWLDVETSNTWNGDGRSNTAVVQGMYDYLHGHGVARVGLYSTAYQWQSITGGYTAATAARYRERWSPAVFPDYPLHQAPLWVATGGDGSGARASCSTSFTGGPTRMVQFIGDDGFDTNAMC